MESQVRMDLVFPRSGQEVMVCVPRLVAETIDDQCVVASAVCRERTVTRLDGRTEDARSDRH